MNRQIVAKGRDVDPSGLRHGARSRADGDEAVIELAGPSAPDATDLVRQINDQLDDDVRVTVFFIERFDITATTTTTTTTTATTPLATTGNHPGDQSALMPGSVADCVDRVGAAGADDQCQSHEAFDEDSGGGGDADRDRDAEWDGQIECVRAGYDEHRHGPFHCDFGVTEDRPDSEPERGRCDGDVEQAPGEWNTGPPTRT